MKFASAVSIGVVALVVSASVSLRAQQRTTKDGVYTPAQATRGSALFQMRCALCHGDKLEGAAGPPLVGDVFLGPHDKQPVSDLFSKIRATMPADAPGSLKPADTAEVMAFVLSKAMFPAGEVELPAEIAALKEIKFVAKQ